MRVRLLCGLQADEPARLQGEGAELESASSHAVLDERGLVRLQVRHRLLVRTVGEG